MTYYKNIENFYKINENSLINGEFRPVVSYNKDAEEYINKLVKIYKDNGTPSTITLAMIEKGLGVSRGSNVASTESPLTWISLGLIEEVNNGKNKKDSDYQYRFTQDFIEIANSEIIPGVHILNKLYSIESLSTISKFTNLLLCTLREGYIEGSIIDFPRENNKYVENVTVEQRKKYSQRIKRIYGYAEDTNSSPHASMRAINNLVKIELIRQVGKTTEGFSQYEITEYGHHLLSVIDLNLSKPCINFQEINAPLQQIFYGAPGTGKSNEIKILTGEGKDGIVFSKNFTFRTTFHPDFDYSTFVGAYKPIWNNDKEKIVYEFRPQTFLKAYVAAWTHPSENVALVIEEINRGNCAQIFGDIFQLLDRENNGLSKYPIESDIDMKYFLSRALSGEIEEPWTGIIPEDDKEKINDYYSKHYDDAFAKIKSGEILTLPKNLSILATMNTSDQSLFPMDSAFKRRWEWQYMPIKNANKNWVIHLADNYENIDWWEFLERINNVISDLTTSEDKQLGYFFCQPDEFVSPEPAPDAEPDLISAKRFVDKVIFYLWNDVFKDYAFDTKCCKDKDSKEVLFAKFYNEDGKSVNIEILKNFFETLMVENKPSLVEKIVPPTDVSGEEELSKTDVSSVDEEPNSTDKVSEEADLFTSATTGEK